MNNGFKDSLIIGLVIFATFFGAGNLIFPPALGLQSGNNWFQAVLGLMLSGILLPILGIIVVSYVGGSVEKLTKPIGKNFHKFFLLVLMLFLSLVAIPRTGAVATEMGVQVIAPRVSSVISILTFFTLTYYFANDKSNVINKIGKILTPMLVGILLCIVVKGIITPVAVPAKTALENSFSNALLGAYQTGDLLASFMIAGIFISDIINKGYTSDKERNRMTVRAGTIGFLCLLVIYGGLLYLGAMGNRIFPQGMDRTALLISLVDIILGRVGVVGLAISVFLACMTTSIGLSSSVANYFNELTNGKISYKVCVVMICSLGMLIALLGVEKIVTITNPVFIVLYPISIVILILGLFHKYIPNNGSYKGAVFLTLITSIIEALLSIGVKSTLLSQFIFILPLSSQGFAWVLPSIIGFIGGTLIFKGLPEKKGIYMKFK